MAQLKSTNITGNLAVTGNILASKIIKLGGTSDQILLANGDVATLSNLGAGNVTGSSLTDNTIVLGGGGSSVKTSSKTIATTVGTDDTTVPTSQAVKNYVTGLGYITGSYLPLAGGQMSGPITYPVASGSSKTSNYISAGGGYGTGSGKEGLKILALEQSDATMGLGVDLTGGPYELTVATSRITNSQASKIVFATHTVGTTAYKTLATLSASGAESPTVTFNVAGTIQENGTSLSAKYLGISAKAADADKLDGRDGSYYLNYNNLTNKPTIPNPTNYYWANVKVASSSNTSTTPIVKSLGVSDGSSATAAVKATWQYNSTTDCIELVWA